MRRERERQGRRGERGSGGERRGRVTGGRAGEGRGCAALEGGPIAEAGAGREGEKEGEEAEGG